jgi:hypothetical protein
MLPLVIATSAKCGTWVDLEQSGSSRALNQLLYTDMDERDPQAVPEEGQLDKLEMQMLV